MKNSKRFLWLNMVVMAAIIIIREGSILLRLNDVFFGNNYDSLKNYYTLLYHVKWDKSYLFFEGMNYPYFEHVLFTDNQPLIANFLKLLHDLGIPVEHVTLGITNGLLFVGLMLTTLFAFKCLIKFNTEPWLAALAAVGLTLLSPQTDRLNVHFALSYSFIIPLIIYQGLLFLEKPDYKRSVIIALIIICVSFIHAYYLSFALLIAGCLFLVSLTDKKRLTIKKAILYFLVQAVGSLVVVESIMLLSDHVKDRPSYPWSPLLENFNYYGVFVPIGKPLAGLINDMLEVPQVEWEAMAYIGGAATIFVFISTLLFPLFLSLNRKALEHPFLSGGPKKWFIVLVALLSLLLPFIYIQAARNEWFYLHMGPLRQFRSITRFYWVFYWAVNFMLFSFLSQKLVHAKHKALRWLIIPVLLIFGYDVSQYYNRHIDIHEIPLMSDGSPEQQEMREILKAYDVLVPLPYFHIGSESFVYRHNKDEQFKQSMAISMASGVPMSAVMLSRTSLSQTLNNLQYAIMSVTEPAFVSDLRDKKVAVLINKNEELTTNENLLAASCKDVLFQDEHYKLCELNLQSYVELYKADTTHLQFSKENLAESLFFKDYDVSEEKKYFGSGSLKIEADSPRTVEVVLLNGLEGETVTVGFWVYINEQNKAMETLDVKMLQSEKVLVYAEGMSIRDNLKALDGSWGYTEKTYKLTENTAYLGLEFKKNGLYPSPTYIDGLTIKHIKKAD